MSLGGAICVTTKDLIKTITINVPERRNALSPENALIMAREVEACVDDGTRVLVLTGAGGAFCAGADLQADVFRRALKEGPPTEAELQDMLDTTYHRLSRAIHHLPRPVIAAVDGPAAGVGCSIALLADITLASTRARFVEVFMNIALITDGGSAHVLPRLVGMKRAMEMVLTADPVTAEDALRTGMINRVFPPEQLEGKTRKLARRLAEGPVASMGIAKRTLHESQSMSFDEALDLESRRQARLMTNPDFMNAVRAFLEKRRPSFS